MNIKFHSDDNLSLNEKLEISVRTIVIRAVSHKNSRYYPQVMKI